MRDHLQTSRKYALAYLEYLDRLGITTRNGDERRLKRPNQTD
ncbi:MAG UNVERIFIED_CONTAM: SelB C-terminal domain-containing protein [Anaerolineae bacterium]